MSEDDQADPEFEALVDYIQEHRGVDFRGYKRKSLSRRVRLRMGEVGMDEYAAYQAKLEADPQEFTALLNTILINVTSFFRDAEAWDVLRREVVPEIVAKGSGHDAIRIWSVGCASGEEPYSLAMLFAEAMGSSEFCRRVKVYATDLDEHALQVARHATYAARDLEAVPEDLRGRYFEPVNGVFLFQRELRKCVIFGRHNVVSDAPISRIDLILCRNLLIYLDSETQELVLPRLHYALAENGVLMLGKAETQLARSRLFTAVEGRHRIFRKIGTEWRRSPGGSIAAAPDPRNGNAAAQQQLSLLETILDYAATADLAVDLDGKLIFTNSTARRLLEVGEADMGKPFQDLPISYRPAELRGRIEEANATLRAVRLDHQEFRLNADEPIRLTIDVIPLLGRDGKPMATLLSFTETTRLFMVEQELQAAQESLETTIEELQSANEELETTNEELQSSNEELETTNEELQSTNEELETMNEELRSANEEMEAANEELRRQSEEVAHYRRHAEAVLRSISAGVIVVDEEMRVHSWNRWCENMWGLRADEAEGQNLLTLDIGLPLQRLEDALSAALLESPEQRADAALEGLDRRGRRVRCRVRVLPFLHEDRRVRGALVLMEDVTEVEQTEEYARYLGKIIGESLNEVYFLDPATLHFTLANRGAEQKLGYGIAELRLHSLADLMPHVPAEALRALCDPLIRGEKQEAVFETVIRSRTGREYPAEICLQHFGTETPPFLLAIVHDVTERHRLRGEGKEEEKVGG